MYINFAVVCVNFELNSFRRCRNLAKICYILYPLNIKNCQCSENVIEIYDVVFPVLLTHTSRTLIGPA